LGPLITLLTKAGAGHLVAPPASNKKHFNVPRIIAISSSLHMFVRLAR